MMAVTIQSTVRILKPWYYWMGVYNVTDRPDSTELSIAKLGIVCFGSLYPSSAIPFSLIVSRSQTLFCTERLVVSCETKFPGGQKIVFCFYLLFNLASNNICYNKEEKNGKAGGEKGVRKKKKEKYS